MSKELAHFSPSEASAAASKEMNTSLRTQIRAWLSTFYTLRRGPFTLQTISLLLRIRIYQPGFWIKREKIITKKRSEANNTHAMLNSKQIRSPVVRARWEAKAGTQNWTRLRCKDSPRSPRPCSPHLLTKKEITQAVILYPKWSKGNEATWAQGAVTNLRTKTDKKSP